MNSQLQKQILIGGLAGVLIVALTWVLLSGKRDDLTSLKASIVSLQAEVDKGYQLKANYERLKAEVEQQQKLIEGLIKLMPTDTDKGEIPYKIKKLADTAGIEQVSFNIEAPIKKEYYTEYPFRFTFKATYHMLGQFTSLISGNDKIINATEIQMKRERGNSAYTMGTNCRISAFVYNPDPPKTAAPAPGGAKPATAAAKPAAADKKSAGEGD